MGMYDTLLVSKILIDKVIEGSDILLESSDDYYDFQTKDLDNFLTNFYIEADGSFAWKKQQFKWIEPDLNIKSDRKWNFGHMEPVGDAEMIQDTRTAYIDFYDVFNTKEERIFVTFTAHVKCGKLVESLVIKSIERTNLQEEAIKTKKHKEKWERINNDWRWIFGSFIRDSRWKVSKIFRPLINWVDKIQNNLLKSARLKEFPDSL